MNKGYKVEKVGDKLKHLLVDDCVAIGDNLETDLAGHSENDKQYADVLKISGKYIGEIIENF